MSTVSKICHHFQSSGIQIHVSVLNSIWHNLFVLGLPAMETCAPLTQVGTSLTDECAESETSLKYLCLGTRSVETATCEENTMEWKFDNCSGRLFLNEK